MYIQVDREGRQLSGLSEPQVTCPGYERGEVMLSRTEKGHLASDVTLDAKNGRLVIADFGVDLPQLKNSAKADPLLREWLQRFEKDDMYRLQVRGYSDCVGGENNEQLRRERARSVLALLGPSARKRVLSSQAAPLGTYLSDNTTREGRARNRAVVIIFTRLTPPPPPPPKAAPVVLAVLSSTAAPATIALLAVLPTTTTSSSSPVRAILSSAAPASATARTSDRRPGLAAAATANLGSRPLAQGNPGSRKRGRGIFEEERRRPEPY